MTLSRRAALSLGISGVLTACATSGVAMLPPDQRRDAERVAHYLNGLRGVTAEFTQTGPGDDVSAGRFSYDPGHLRLDYVTPHPMTLVAANGRIVMNDSATGAVTHLSLSRNPLGLLLRTPIRFDHGIQITGVQRGVNSLQISAAEADNPSQGLLTMQFADRQDQLTLIGLDGVDARQHRLVLHIRRLQEGTVFPADTFSSPEG
ncbi:outer membrane lipoprotein carrier protein LolA [Kozakia baliensis]|uniref:LolA family protein n=1 Tax=Kozakia baliensis TaxID=153496 RepID=UPI00345B87A8